MKNEIEEIIDVLMKFQQGYDESDVEKGEALMAEQLLKKLMMATSSVKSIIHSHVTGILRDCIKTTKIDVFIQYKS